MEEATFVKREPEDKEILTVACKQGTSDDLEVCDPVSKEFFCEMIEKDAIDMNSINTKPDSITTLPYSKNPTIKEETESEDSSSDLEKKVMESENDYDNSIVEPIITVDCDLPVVKGDAGPEFFHSDFGSYTGVGNACKFTSVSKETSESDESEERKYQCNVCLKRFIHRGSLNKHLIIHNGKKQSGEKFQCKICFKYFGEPGSLKSHSVVHSGKREFKCSICNKEFLRRSNLRQHLAAHSARQFECPLCHKFFRYAWNLRAHERVHTRDRSFECAICSKLYGSKSILKEHLMTHDNIRSFTCLICSKAFLRKYYLQVHMVTHTKERNFECHVCGRKFARVNELRHHTARHDRIEPV
ncbi:zinc finger protein 60 [Anabrus simplex]|uniref:zinc finger protein 60 n=1 Tax=Anabrus simplex TaxID=316456 RepID=UPI0035A3AE1F